MRNLTPQRRRAAILAGASAAVIPSITLFMRNSHSSAVDFAGGLLIGMMLTVSLGINHPQPA
jgi:hypothetical protein